ncbi:unnamed protein product [Durusdinium trenchii]|uniref:Uncharacterized protein n=1 Tax=Durusdinium trenchii TaxID=1381693 RepID=A0ABP0SMH6_9DINO
MTPTSVLGRRVMVDHSTGSASVGIVVSQRLDNYVQVANSACEWQEKLLWIAPQRYVFVDAAQPAAESERCVRSGQGSEQRGWQWSAEEWNEWYSQEPRGRSRSAHRSGWRKLEVHAVQDAHALRIVQQLKTFGTVDTYHDVWNNKIDLLLIHNWWQRINSNGAEQGCTVLSALFKPLV